MPITAAFCFASARNIVAQRRPILQVAYALAAALTGVSWWYSEQHFRSNKEYLAASMAQLEAQLAESSSSQKEN